MPSITPGFEQAHGDSYRKRAAKTPRRGAATARRILLALLIAVGTVLLASGAWAFLAGH
jgi:hypothetical protein